MSRQDPVGPSAPICFVLVPSGVKPDGHGGSVNFDAVYGELIAPAVQDAGLQPLRADPGRVGSPHKPMFERLILADYAVADLTTADSNVFYELGVRYAVRPGSTVLMSADVSRVAFALAPDPVRPYALDGSGQPADAAGERARLIDALRDARRTTGGPVFRLLDERSAPRIQRLKTDMFRDEAAYATRTKRRLAEARSQGPAALSELEHDLGRLEDVEAGVLVDLVLSYRATKAWREMIRLVEQMPEPLARTVLVQEQYGFALNRAGRSHEAERTLLAVITDHGPSSETYGLLGRVYKDRWDAARDGSVVAAQGHLEQAIGAYRSGFEADWRDAYPGVNAVTLMEIRDPGGLEQLELAAVVRYASRRRIESGAPDYWDHATRLELGVVARDRGEALAGASAALTAVREAWEPESTAYNLSLIRRARAARGELFAWADELERDLMRAAGKGS